MPEGQHDIAAVARRPDARQSTTVTRRPAHSASMAVALPTAPAPITTAWRRAPPMTPGAITDVAGIEVGHFTDTRRPTGCTVVLARHGAVGGVDVRGAAPGTRETDLLRPATWSSACTASCSRAAAPGAWTPPSGAMRWLEEAGSASPWPARLPIVPAAVLFDLPLGDRASAPMPPRATPPARPQHEAPAEGNVGAGTGAWSASSSASARDEGRHRQRIGHASAASRWAR
jgi:L-aminopeptidase/D-esterase-like protein